MGHDPAGHPAADTPRPVELAYQVGDHALLERVRTHAGQSTTSSDLEVKELTIGELARATGVATSALRYWEELGLLPPPTRISGRRRYPASAVGLVGMILVSRDAGFTLDELKALMASRDGGPNAWRELYERKLAELDERIARAQAARTAIAHALARDHRDGIFHCPTFARGVAGRLAGLPLQEAHSQAHSHGED
jgi:DNA-binding transcriptional MerR regulator